MKKIIIIIILLLGAGLVYSLFGGASDTTPVVPEATSQSDSGTSVANEELIASSVSGEVSYAVKKVFFNKPLEDVVGVSSSINGDISYDQDVLNTRLTLDTSSFSSGSEARDEHVSDFIGTSISAALVDQSITLPFEGTLPVEVTLVDVTNEIPFDLIITEDETGIAISGNGSLRMSDFSIDAPGNPNLYSVDDEVILSLDIQKNY